MNDESKVAKVTILVPNGCKKTSLGVDAMDANTRALAWQTHIYGQPGLLLCRSFSVKHKPDGTKVVMLEVMEKCFEIVEDGV